MPNNNLSYKWAAGHDNPGGLQYVHLTVPSGDFAFRVVTSIGSYLAGINKRRLSGPIFKSGFKSTKWNLDFVTRLQLKYCRDTFCGGDWSGLATVQTRLPNNIASSGSEFAVYNCSIFFPEPAVQQNVWITDLGVPGYSDYTISIDMMVEI